MRLVNLEILLMKLENNWKIMYLNLLFFFKLNCFIDYLKYIYFFKSTLNLKNTDKK